MLAVALIVDPLLAGVVLKTNPYPLVFRCLKESGITAFFTRSSAANIPVNMELCEKLGMDKEMYAVSIPLGATINMDGAAITIAVMSLAAANTMGIQVSFPTALILAFIATLAACGAKDDPYGPSFFHASDRRVARGPGDLGPATTGAKRRHESRTAGSVSASLHEKRMIRRTILFSCKR
jgi:hypothetical protein